MGRPAIFDSESGLWKIPLTQNEFTSVDEWDWEFLQQWNWKLYTNRSGGKYAMRTVAFRDCNRTIYMHRVVAERAGLFGSIKLFVDHKNGNGLDNRCSNIRAATMPQNAYNRPMPCYNRSGLKGVTYNSECGKWRARIQVNGKVIWLGYFDTKEEAHQAYCAASAKYHGEFGRTK